MADSTRLGFGSLRVDSEWSFGGSADPNEADDDHDDGPQSTDGGRREWFSKSQRINTTLAFLHTS